MTAASLARGAWLWADRQARRTALAAWTRERERLCDPTGDQPRGYELAIACLRADLEYQEFRRGTHAGHGGQHAGRRGLLLHPGGRGHARDADGRRLDLDPVLPESRQAAGPAAAAALALPGAGAQGGGARGDRGGRS